MVEDELSLDFVEFHVLAVEFGGDVGLPVLGDLGKLFGEVDLRHGSGIISGKKKSQRSCDQHGTCPAGEIVDILDRGHS
jgi:hypothetical protein